MAVNKLSAVTYCMISSCHLRGSEVRLIDSFDASIQLKHFQNINNDKSYIAQSNKNYLENS